MSSIADLHFLVAEDQRVQRTVLVGILEALGAKAVHESSDGREALEILHRRKLTVDVVITDLDMPGMDGLEFLRHVSELGRRGVSIILTSAMGDKLLASAGAMAKAYGLSLLGSLEKPLTAGKLVPLIQLHLRSALEPRPTSVVRAFGLDEIRAGLANDEFEPHYQPQVDVVSGAVKGAEALARWAHPRYGLVAPGSFIPVLEQAQLLDDLTFRMLTKAALACAAWHALKWQFRVSVNLSLVSLSDTSLADRITQTVLDQGLDPKHMVLEITESAAMTEVAPALENLARLRMRGFALSIDDYGTGYSTLRQLTRVPFTELKIDGSFVTGASANALSRAIVESSVDTARRLGIETVAEGVETQEDWKTLQRLGCGLAQGYFFARPMTGDSFIKYCSARSASERASLSAPLAPSMGHQTVHLIKAR